MIVGRLADLEFAALPGRWSADPFSGAGGEAGLSTRIVRVTPGSRRCAHRHPRSAEAVYVAQGHGHAWVDGEVVAVAPGDAFLVPRGVPHATVPDGDAELLLVCFFPDGDLASNTEELPGEVHVAGAPGR